MKTLGQYQELMQAIQDTLITEVDVQFVTPAEEILRHQNLAVILNHATPISWIPAIATLSSTIASHAGGKERVPLGVVDRFFFKVPGLRQIAKFITQNERPWSRPDLIHFLKNHPKHDVIIFPEGAGTFFQNIHGVHEFRSQAFINLVIEGEVPLVLAVHRGSEVWNQTLPIPTTFARLVRFVSRYWGEGLHKEQKMNLPLQLQKISKFTLKVDLISHKELRQLPQKDRAEFVRQRMNELYFANG